MKIYTKGGDKGETQVYADKPLRLAKDDLVLECYGTLDELNAQIGLLVAESSSAIDTTLLESVQRNLFNIGFAISASSGLPDNAVQLLEQSIDEMQDRLPAQTHFILPGGCKLAALSHVSRTLTRRAERRLVALSADYPVPENCLAFINRLSDYFFVLARHFNQLQGISDKAV